MRRSSELPAASESRRKRRNRLLASLGVSLTVWVLLSFAPAAPRVAALLGDTYEALYLRFSAYRGPVRVGLQVGHLNSYDHPEELANLRYNTGAHVEGLNEVDVNFSVAQHLKESLELEGVVVDLLPATVPEGYKADLLVSLHADASPDPARRGYKSAHARDPRNELEPLLKAYIDQAYFYYSGLADDDANVSGSMLDYYAFNHRRFRHSVAPATPAVLVEMGYLSNAGDRAFLADPVDPAYALKQGIMAYLTAQNRLPETSVRR